jgi:hypothetical protein
LKNNPPPLYGKVEPPTSHRRLIRETRTPSKRLDLGVLLTAEFIALAVFDLLVARSRRVQTITMTHLGDQLNNPLKSNHSNNRVDQPGRQEYGIYKKP